MGRSIRVTTDLSTETWQARKGWQDIFRVLNEKNMQPRTLYPARLSFKMEGEIKSFQAGTERICDHQTSSARNFKENSQNSPLKGSLMEQSTKTGIERLS